MADGGEGAGGHAAEEEEGGEVGHGLLVELGLDRGWCVERWINLVGEEGSVTVAGRL